ncbi:MAG TPA: choice-of-anchor O protein, partial [Pelovirga sp.]|nr:choice-of-anchor O protein [Pelovirga sp.]
MKLARRIATCLAAFTAALICLTPVHAAYKGPGLVKAALITQTHEVVGIANVWNTKDEFRIRLIPNDSWELRSVKIYVGHKPVPATRRGNLIPGRFTYKDSYTNINDEYWLKLNLTEDLGFSWGEPYADMRLQNVAVHLSAVKLDAEGNPGESLAAWAYTGEGVATRTGEIDEESLTDFEGVGAGWWFQYQLAHPKTGHFVDSPVQGLNVSSPTFDGLTYEGGAFNYFPGETVTFSVGDYLLGSTVAAHKVSPLDLFEMADTDNVEVINMARVLQSLDVEGDPKDGILITNDVVASLDAAMKGVSLDQFDFSDSDQIDQLIIDTAYQGDFYGLDLTVVSAEDAKKNLDDALNAAMFRKNVSKSPSLASSKSKLNVMGVWFPALRANASLIYGGSYPENPEDYTDPTTEIIEYFDEDGNFIRSTDRAKPLVIVYTDEIEGSDGAHDVWAAISRDDGNTWKRKNISRMADRSSFTLANGEEFFGHCKKPVFQVKGNKIMIAWTSKFARGGKPRYAIQVCPDTNNDGIPDPCDVCNGNDENKTCGPDYTYDDPYYVDEIWGVSGPQRSVDYAEQGYPEVGEVPYSAVWVARGIISTQADVNAGRGRFVGDIVWFKPERLTSGRRDANQVFMGGADGAGFAISWQE